MRIAFAPPRAYAIAGRGLPTRMRKQPDIWKKMFVLLLLLRSLELQTFFSCRRRRVSPESRSLPAAFMAAYRRRVAASGKV